MVKRHNFEWKQKQLAEIKNFLGKHDVIVIADLNLFPASLFQGLRKKLHGKAEIKVSKVRILRKALAESKKELQPLLEKVNRQVALIGTQMSPFELYLLLKKNKGNIYAKPGITAPNDIMIPAGDTGLPPGPALSELKAIGLKARLAGPTISIDEDKIIVRKGEQINEKIVSVLAKLDIKPVEVMLNIVAAMEKGQLYSADVLHIDTDKIFSDFSQAYRNAINLSYNIAYPVKQNIELLVQRAFNDAKAVSLSAGILNKVTAGNMLAKAESQAKALQALMPETK